MEMERFGLCCVVVVATVVDAVVVKEEVMEVLIVPGIFTVVEDLADYQVDFPSGPSVS